KLESQKFCCRLRAIGATLSVVWPVTTNAAFFAGGAGTTGRGAIGVMFMPKFVVGMDETHDGTEWPAGSDAALAGSLRASSAPTDMSRGSTIVRASTPAVGVNRPRGLEKAPGRVSSFTALSSRLSGDATETPE